MKTLNLQQAAKLLHVHPVTLLQKANHGEVPAAKIGRRWVFIDIDLFEYIRTKYNWRALQGDSLEDTKCHFTNAKVHHTGGSNLPTTERRYREVLGLQTKR